MSGGIDEAYDLKQIRNVNYYSPVSLSNGKKNLDSNSFWEILLNARKKQSVIGANINLLATDFTNDVQLSNGLVRGIKNKIIFLTIR
jgi:hypothetical protein